MRCASHRLSITILLNWTSPLANEMSCTSLRTNAGLLADQDGILRWSKILSSMTTLLGGLGSNQTRARILG
jgi:hypothetical protein